jgi:putative membrane protein
VSNPVQAKDNTKAISIILFISAVAFAFLVWLIYFNTKSESADPNALTFLPGFNALLNGLSATCIIIGVALIKRGHRTAHIASMVSAITLSAIFLVSYIVYHNIHGDTKFASEGLIRYTYFGILISHITLTVFALPLIFSAVYFALTKQFELHKKVVKYTVPIWLYVSITGVIIYFLLRFNS